MHDLGKRYIRKHIISKSRADNSSRTLLRRDATEQNVWGESKAVLSGYHNSIPTGDVANSGHTESIQSTGKREDDVRGEKLLQNGMDRYDSCGMLLMQPRNGESQNAMQIKNVHKRRRSDEFDSEDASSYLHRSGSRNKSVQRGGKIAVDYASGMCKIRSARLEDSSSRGFKVKIRNQSGHSTQACHLISLEIQTMNKQTSLVRFSFPVEGCHLKETRFIQKALEFKVASCPVEAVHHGKLVYCCASLLKHKVAMEGVSLTAYWDEHKKQAVVEMPTSTLIRMSANACLENVAYFTSTSSTNRVAVASDLATAVTLYSMSRIATEDLASVVLAFSLKMSRRNNTKVCGIHKLQAIIMQDLPDRIKLLRVLASLSMTSLALNDTDALFDVCCLLVFSVENIKSVSRNCCALLKLYRDNSSQIFTSCDKIPLSKARTSCIKSLQQLLEKCNGPLHCKPDILTLREAVCIDVDDHKNIFELRVEPPKCIRPAKVDFAWQKSLGNYEITSAMECYAQMMMPVDTNQDTESLVIMFHQLKRYLCHLEYEAHVWDNASMNIGLASPQILK